MATQTTLNAPPRKTRHLAPNYIQTGQPDPRPVTDYTTAVSAVSGHTRITITLSEPCVIRTPAWKFVSGIDGNKIPAASVTVVDNKTFFFDFAGLLASDYCFIDVPYQDTAVQNFQGGFVRSGGQWFRKFQ